MQRAALIFTPSEHYQPPAGQKDSPASNFIRRERDAGVSTCQDDAPCRYRRKHRKERMSMWPHQSSRDCTIAAQYAWFLDLMPEMAMLAYQLQWRCSRNAATFRGRWLDGTGGVDTAKRNLRFTGVMPKPEFRLSMARSATAWRVLPFSAIKMKWRQRARWWRMASRACWHVKRRRPQGEISSGCWRRPRREVADENRPHRMLGRRFIMKGYLLITDIVATIYLIEITASHPAACIRDEAEIRGRSP